MFVSPNPFHLEKKCEKEPRLLKKFLKGVGGEDLDPRMSRIRIIGRTEATTYPLTFTTPAIGSGSAVACEQAVGFAGAWDDHLKFYG